MLLDALPPPPPPPVPLVALVTRVDAALGRPAPDGPLLVLGLIAASRDDVVLGGRRARALYLLGRHDEAANAYWCVLKMHRKGADAYLGLAWTYLDQSQFGMAYQPLAEGLRLMPSFEPGWRELGRAFYWMKRYDRAVAASSRAIALMPSDSQAWLLKGMALGLGGSPALALPILTQASALAPHDALSRRMRGRFLLELGKPADAQVALEAALRVEPGDSESRSLLMKAFSAQGKHFQAFALWWQGTR
jgi:tetratricopeptide (TPR) repeat protein